MMHYRRIEVTGAYEIGDIISFALKTGEAVEAMAVSEDAYGNMTFITVDCLDQPCSMNEDQTNEGGYEASDLRRDLNGEILESFPDELRSALLPFDNGDLLRLPTEREIFGYEEYGSEESEDVKQWAPMESRRNRVAYRDGDWEWYWLQNRAVANSSGFANVNSFGRAYANNALNSLGVRPAFKIRNH